MTDVRADEPRQFRETPSASDKVRVLGLLARTSVQVLWERLAVRATTEPDEVPPRIEALTASWLAGALCTSVPGARVERFSFGSGSSGTSVRRQIRIEYNDIGRDAGLPEAVFAKSTPSVVTRMANGATGVSAAEAGFYREMRPLLELAAPVGYFSAFSRSTFRSIHLLEDLVSTSGATFCTPTTRIVRAQAEQMVSTLARLHGARALQRFIDRPPAWFETYRRWWERGIATASILRFHRKGFDDASDVVPEQLHGRADDVWRAFVGSVVEHDRLPQQVIHGDVHLGNWYIDRDGAMGLCDWQCVARANGVRDLAYAIATALPVDDRRAWERELVELYVNELSETGATTPSVAATWDTYRRQLPGALLMWTPTHSPPRFLPAMQPLATSKEMIRRITTAICDLNAS